MSRIVSRVALLCFVAAVLFNFPLSATGAVDKTYSKTADKEIVAEIYVTSW